MGREKSGSALCWKVNFNASYSLIPWWLYLFESSCFCFLFISFSLMVTRSAGLLCTDWIFWSHTALLLTQFQWSQNGWLSELLLWMGHPGLLSCISGSVLRSRGCFCCHLCNSWYSLRFSCNHHGHSKNLAEALPYPHQEGAYKGNKYPSTMLIFLLVISFTIMIFVFDILCNKYPCTLSVSDTLILLCLLLILSGVHSGGSWRMLFPTKVRPWTWSSLENA